MKKKSPPKSLKKKILIFMILCWGVPVTVFFAFTTLSYHQEIVEKAEGLMEDELHNIASFASIRIGDAIAICQRPSYEKTWENAWKKYENGSNDRNEYLQEVNTSLKGKFYQDERFNMYAYYCYGSENPDCFSSRTGISYHSYLEEIQPGVEDVIAMDSSYAYVRVTEGRMFIIRNLYTTVDYVRFGTLVVELNKYKVFQDVPLDVRENMFVCIGSGSDVLELGIPKEGEKEKLAAQLLKQYDNAKRDRMDRREDRNYIAYLYQKQYDTYHIGVVLLAERTELYSSLYEFYTIAVLLMILFVPLVCYGIYFLRRHIQVPIGQIMQASKRMEAGEMGVTVEGEMPNSEFQYMKESFDSMSGQVRCLFEYAYFYIMSMRFGQRLRIEQEIDEELRYLMVPPLILQPLGENAVVHGVEVMANGLIRLKVYHDREHVYLEVRNTGKEMTEEAKKKIEAILEGTEAQIPKEPGRHTSIGIQNVNRRIRLMYGEEYGLTIVQEADFETVSKITIPYEKRQEEKSAKERNQVEEELKNMARLNK